LVFSYARAILIWAAVQFPPMCPFCASATMRTVAGEAPMKASVPVCDPGVGCLRYFVRTVER
jgi:hypothetical protein